MLYELTTILTTYVNKTIIFFYISAFVTFFFLFTCTAGIYSYLPIFQIQLRNR